MLETQPRIFNDVESPPPPRATHAGVGHIELQQIHNRTEITRVIARNPLKILTPRSAEKNAAIYLGTFGGGLVAGDDIRVHLHAGPDTLAFLSTQSATKVYRAVAGQGSRQSLHATLDPNATLIVWPDPIICFSDAIYQQTQRFDLAESASLALVDWQTSGRHAAGERWAFDRYESRNHITIANRCVLADAILLDRSQGPIADPFRAGRFDCLATVVLLGPAFANAADAILAHTQSQRLERAASFITAASRITGGLLLRVLGNGAQSVGQYLHARLQCISQVLKHDPWQRKW